MFLTELAEPTLLVIYPGRFQPFHKGHYQVYEYLTGKFGRNNVYIATSNKTDNAKSPFTFAEKSYFMQLTGVPADRIVQATQPYQITNVLQSGNINVADPANTVVIFAVSQKDMDEDPRFSFAPKKDGSAPYFQPLKDIGQTESMDKHGYIMTVPTFDFKVLDQPMRSGTELRKLYAGSNEQGRQAIIKDLFGRYTREAEQIMNAKIPAEQKELTGLEPVAENSKFDPKRKPLMVKARLSHPFADSDEEALALYINDKEERDINNVEDEEHGLERRINNIERQLQDLLHKNVDECGGTGVVANKKQANDPRYKTSLTKDVRPGQINKSLRAFDLAEQSAVDRLTQHEIDHLSSLIDEIKQRITTEKLPQQYVEALKKRIEKLKSERAKLAFNP
jgi:hypothetical protein